MTWPRSTALEVIIDQSMNIKTAMKSDSKLCKAFLGWGPKTPKPQTSFEIKNHYISPLLFTYGFFYICI
jgi:hypothetical protein